MIATFLTKLTQFEKTGSQGNLKIKFHFQSKKLITLHFRSSIVGFAFIFRKGNELNLKEIKIQTAKKKKNAKKKKKNAKRTFPEKKIIATFIKV